MDYTQLFMVFLFVMHNWAKSKTKTKQVQKWTEPRSSVAPQHRVDPGTRPIVFPKFGLGVLSAMVWTFEGPGGFEWKKEKEKEKEK